VEAVVMAAGEGRRLRPLTERWPKPVLPIDGRPVIATLARELAAAGLAPVTVVVGHLAEQIEELLGDGTAFGLELRYARQAVADGSADAVHCALAAGARPPFVVTAADTVFAPGDARRFADAFATSDAPAAMASRPDGSPAPLWGLTEEVASRLENLPGPPYELLAAVKGLEIAEIQIGKTRDLTDPLDLVGENFSYLS
jgi:NDP-sugar pyrophosphorylase family protein